MTSEKAALKIIARIRTDFPAKFGIPRQSGLAPSLTAQIVFEKEFRSPDAVRGLEGYSHLWLLWQFSEVANDEWSPTVRPPRLGGNKRVGVFATRSPYRPNPIGLSAVTLLQIDLKADNAPILYVGGADLMDNTPIFDIKPYLPFADSYPDAKAGFADEVSQDKITDVVVSDYLLEKLPENKREAFFAVLKGDPRPSYQNDENRIYGFVFAGAEIKFTVSKNVLYVKSVERV